MQPRVTAFNEGKAAEFENCLEPEMVMYTADGEFIGRAQVLEYLGHRYFKCAPDLCYKMTMHEVQAFGNALWYSYDYSIDTPKEHVAGDPPGIGAKGLSTLPAALNAVVGNNPCHLATSAQVHKLTRARPLLICVVQH